MLNLRKNNAVTGVVKDSVEVREMELGWYKKYFKVRPGNPGCTAGFTSDFSTSGCIVEIPKCTCEMHTLRK